MTMNYLPLEQRIANWGMGQPEVMAGIVIGSRAREERPADEWSDLDLILFVFDHSPFISNDAWLDTFGAIWLKQLGSIGSGNWEWIVVYEGGYKVDFALALASPNAATLQDLIEGCPHQGVLSRGVRPLFSKRAYDEAISLPQRPLKPNPTPKQLDDLCASAWLDAAKALKALRRGGLWQAKQLCDVDLKKHLLALLEWHAHATRGVDTWHDGRFLESWADPRAIAALPETFAIYASDDIRRAILATMTLISWLGRETAAKLGYPYSEATETTLRGWIESI
jgi:aminoglycoside 6-adenylyltransferase